MLHEATTRRLLKAFYDVYNRLGYGFLEKVYERALAIELGRSGTDFVCQAPVRVHYDGLVVGCYFADILVADAVIVELKATECIMPEHLAQLRNYLKATDIEVGLLLNFGRKPQFERVLLTNDRKHHPSRSARSV